MAIPIRNRLMSLFHLPFLFFNQSVGVEPDESSGDPAARVLTIHKSTGETHYAAVSGNLTPQ